MIICPLYVCKYNEDNECKKRDVILDFITDQYNLECKSFKVDDDLCERDDSEAANHEKKM